MTNPKNRRIKTGTARVLILNDRDFNSGFGGQASFIRNLHPFLDMVYTLKYLTLPGAYFRQNIIPIRFVYFFRVLLFLIRQKRNFNLIISHTPEASFVASHFKIPFLHIFHGNTNPLSVPTFWYGRYFAPIFKYFESRIIRRADLLFTIGEYRPDAEKLFNPINIDSTKRLAVSEKKDFVFAGRLESVKNVEQIIQNYNLLWPEIKGAHKLHIIGTGSKKSSLVKLVNDLNLKDNVIFHGLVKNEVSVEIIMKSLILLMASSHEGFPMVIAESLTVGTPVISTNVGDIQSVIKDGFNGFLLPVNFSNDDFCNKVISILADYEHFSTNAFKSSSVFNAREIADSLISACDKIIRK
jgi:glycosyltransferase involved in cell wall biosynthesis